MSDTPGYYCGTFQGATTDTNNKNNMPFLHLLFDIGLVSQEGEWAQMDQPLQRPVKFCISDGVWNSPDAKRILVERLTVLGFNGDFEAPQFTGEILQGQVMLKAEPDGKFTKWIIANLGGPRKKTPVTSDLARTLNAKFNAAKATMAAPAGAPTPPETPAAPSTPSQAPEPVGAPAGGPGVDAPGGNNIPY